MFNLFKVIKQLKDLKELSKKSGNFALGTILGFLIAFIAPSLIILSVLFLAGLVFGFFAVAGGPYIVGKIAFFVGFVGLTVLFIIFKVLKDVLRRIIMQIRGPFE